MLSMGIPEEKIVVIPLGVDTNTFKFDKHSGIKDLPSNYVVIGSFPSQEMAENYAQSIESTTSIVNVSELNTYRVVLSMHNELNDALSALEEARKRTSKAWIAVQ